MKNQKHTVRKVIDYIEEHLEEKLNLEQIAEHAGYSRFHLNRIFMEETGDTIHKYVQERRLTMAAEKLVDTGYGHHTDSLRCRVPVPAGIFSRI